MPTDIVIITHDSVFIGVDFFHVSPFVKKNQIYNEKVQINATKKKYAPINF